MAAPSDARRWQLLLLLLAGLTHKSSEFVVEFNGTACIMASFSATFFINYETKSGFKNATLDLPPNATVLNSSFCGKENASESRLAIAFGSGHTLTLQFTKNATRYSVQTLSFAYNMSDTKAFPSASSTGIQTVNSTSDIVADLDKKYRCVSHTQIHMSNVTVTLHNATIQAFLSHGNFSKEETHCKQDYISPTTAAPSPKPTTPSPSPVPENPSVSNYNVSGSNGTCLLARMAVQLNMTYEKSDNATVTRVLNINPNKTSASGSCSSRLVTLELRGEGINLLRFTFGMNASASRFFLRGIHVNTTLPDARDPVFKATNDSLRALQATIGNSYRCNAEENIQVTKTFSVNVFNVWVQAFKVEGNEFGSVEECQLDENNMLIPIAVGGALAGLVLIVLIAYLIGRKRSHAGYQTI
ncbi:PREDICTED: lysosome-associated membrane glycoprotein 1 [Chrysochloris asiatica]|uniref:Lysosome-associated membrane glycoprotein 1 n=1 Tax=Chrysochloris asiatica TaxID=185453 RepID=A0A9B0T5Y3_CHRAS|nr:PREDICTED: lysosome-associated membrane glycoprotein 1 [Chrysochloris asiatica]